MLDLRTMIGTMVVCVADPQKSYIVGASDAANEEFRRGVTTESVKTKIPEGAMELTEDTYEKAGIRRIPVTSENYNDILKVAGMPGNCLADRNGEEVMKHIGEIMFDYYSGKISKDDVMSKIKDICKDMRVYQAQSRHTNGKNREDNLQILSQIYEVFQKKNAANAAHACIKKGEEIARANGGTERKDWAYYDSDYYYEAEEIKACLRTAVREMAEEWGTDVPDFTKIENETKLTLDGGMDFNSCWDWQVMQRGNCSIKGYDGAPPKGFSFFYQEHKYTTSEGRSPVERQKGVVQVDYQGKTWKVDVPFNNSLVWGDMKEIFNVKDLLLDHFNEKEFDSTLLEYLAKFNVFTRWYGSVKTPW